MSECLPPLYTPLASTCQAAEVRYYQALLTLYERLGRNSAAARFALAAVRQVRRHDRATAPGGLGEGGDVEGELPLPRRGGAPAPAPDTASQPRRRSRPPAQVAAALPGPEQLAVRAAAQGRLWANVFNCMLEAGRYEVGWVGQGRERCMGCHPHAIPRAALLLLFHPTRCL